MSTRVLRGLRRLVREGRYDLTSHAHLEMEKDRLDLDDVEETFRTGVIGRQELDVLRGQKYRIEGQALDGRPVGIWCRLVEFEGARVLVITIFEVTPLRGGAA